LVGATGPKFKVGVSLMNC